MLRLICCLAGLLVASTVSHGQQAATVTVPQGKVVMIDGKLDEGEWSDAAKLDLDHFARVYVKSAGDYVYLAVQMLQSETGAVDLYLADGNSRLYDLHASAKLGERILQEGKWPEPWTWWNNTGWVANVSRVDSWQERTFLPEPVREYHIARHRFPGKQWKIMLEIMTPATPNWQTRHFPENAATTNSAGWITLTFR